MMAAPCPPLLSLSSSPTVTPPHLASQTETQEASYTSPPPCPHMSPSLALLHKHGPNPSYTIALHKAFTHSAPFRFLCISSLLLLLPSSHCGCCLQPVACSRSQGSRISTERSLDSSLALGLCTVFYNSPDDPGTVDVKIPI